MKALIGTSGFSYKEWKGSFYPDALADRKMLSFYAQHLKTVEINVTFYRMPRIDLLKGWIDQVPEDFRFVLKAAKKITHVGRLADFDSLAYFARVSEVLGERRGPILFQLPPFFQKDVERLAAFLQQVPKDLRSVFEFRHRSWFEPEVYDLLSRYDAALCGGDVDEEGRSPPLVKTAQWGYLRLRRSDYTDDEISKWASQIRAQGYGQVYAFFKHEVAAPALAKKLIAILDDSSTTGRPPES